ncbi:TPA: NAD-dependent ubiquitin ligase [Legionella pneumophila]|nr:ankyrin repeat domain-containing protein [Legionella pneumophila]HAT8868556.1 NAD-dependent ubiquitin ligase [Legionella pneumophila subsp. pneumophila]HAT7071669.1 NAD-dependent ubiquitin ligase [Legionella pneumophila]HAT8642403.1 NAD-dependent ubiquitin ligase [Legionella pneumophila]HAT8889775.1 NAD-dependent ubiquitin ligase [Legionella pneumophila subsp. pneumophila]HAT8931956.1 NAD-dependent ubiquitin ligase [Legionella pneumophila subsp. pneumophila]
MAKELSILLKDALLFAHARYLSKPYTDIFTEENLLHYNNLAKIQLEHGIVHRPNHNIVHTLRSLRYVPYIIDTLLNYGIPALQSQLVAMKKDGILEAFCEKIELASVFKVVGRDSEVSRPDSVELYTRYRVQSAQAFREFVEHSPPARQLFSTVEELDFYQKKVVEDLGNPNNKELAQLVLRLAHDLELQRCRSDESMRSMHSMYDSQYLQSGYTFEPLWQFAKSCIHDTGGSVIGGYTKQLYEFTENPMACWQVLATKEPYDEPLYRESVKGNLNLNEVSRIIRAGNGIARVVTLSDLELKMLSDPRHVRPVIETTKDRAHYTDQRNDRNGARQCIKRTRKSYQAIERQPVVLSTSFFEKYRDEAGKLLPRSISFDEDRGKPKETPYTKKMAVSSVSTNGLYTPYADNRLGFLFDDALLHHKGDRYIWPKNAGSITKPWLNGLLTHSITKSALQTHMRINANDKINNELLRGLTRHGLRALFYSYHSTERINLFYEYLIARDSYHNFPRIPLLLWDYGTGDIHFYSLDLIRADLAKAMQNNILSAERLQKMCSILGITLPAVIVPEQLVAQIIEHFVSWEYSSFIDTDEKAKELVFQQVVAILSGSKSQEELNSLGLFCGASGTLLQQPVELNCDSSHVVNFSVLMNAEQADDCTDTVCPLCKQKITQINMAHATMNKMYSVVADIIRTGGVKAILPHSACTIRLGSLSALFNRNDKNTVDLLCLVARHLAERAIKKGAVDSLIRLINQAHLKKSICTSSRLLYIAALNSSSATLNCLIQHGAVVNGVDEDKGTAFHYAAFDNSGLAIQQLLAQGANPNVRNQDGIAALHVGAQYGNSVAVDALLSFASIEVDIISSSDGATPFLTAVKYGQEAVVGSLIHARANISHVNNVGDSAMHIAAEYGYDRVINLLLTSGAVANHLDKSGAAPFFRAAAYGRESALRLLLKDNLQSIDMQNNSGDTALHMAVKFGRIATVRILLANHANTELSNKDGETPLHLAIKFNRQDVVRELMQHGVDYTCKNKNSETPFMLAQKNFDKSLLQCFISEQEKREAQRANSLIH